MAKLRPYADHVLIKRTDAETKIGNIVLPDNAQEQPTRGKILSVGPGKRGADGKLQACGVKKGDVVVFRRYGALDVELDGEKLLIVKFDDILAAVE